MAWLSHRHEHLHPVRHNPKTPVAIGALSLLCNGMGALGDTMTETRNASYMNDFTPEQFAVRLRRRPKAGGHERS